MPGKNYFVDPATLGVQSTGQKLIDYLNTAQRLAVSREARLQKQYADVEQRFRAQRIQLIGPDAARQLTQYALEHASRETNDRLLSPEQARRQRQQREEQSRQFAQRLGVDLDALRQLSQHARAEKQQLVTAPSSALGTIQVSEVASELSFTPLSLGSLLTDLPIPPPLTPFGGPPVAVESPPYAWWDRGGMAYKTGSGQIMRRESRLNGDQGLSGSCIWFKNKNAGDYDFMHVSRETGFLVPFIPSASGVIRIQFEVTCLLSQHCLETYNEWGWSEYGAFTQERFVMGILWNWEDEVPVTESDVVLGGTHGEGNGDSCPGVRYLSTPGQVRTLTLQTKMAFPAQVPLWIYVGTLQRIYADLNDVSINTFVSSAWQFTQVRISQP
ncbi:hypothetical protein [Fibrivirga algicola]|uniref:Uncharacterized protein n=1 Tax=Fibrivirga algicola TaxID=2950420 RepID=A0ABX0QC93_9BACT|nr:hypothetical protein [Fibrivirga algicola]NID09548.1 hypothetical protein [Fibrivirga algicola]